MTMNGCSRLTASDLLVHPLHRSKSVRIALSVADFDASPFQLQAKPRMIRPLKSRFPYTTDYAIIPRMVANRRFSFPD
jgi:hypothetical protein